MSLIEIDKRPSAARLRTFGLLLPVFFGGVGALAWWRWDRPVLATVVGTIGTAIVLLYWTLPNVRQPLFVAWMYAVLPIGLCVSYVVLAAVYFLVVTPIGFLRRLASDPLARRFDRNAATYWTHHSPRRRKSDYLRQF